MRLTCYPTRRQLWQHGDYMAGDRHILRHYFTFPGDRHVLYTLFIIIVICGDDSVAITPGRVEGLLSHVECLFDTDYRDDNISMLLRYLGM